MQIVVTAAVIFNNGKFLITQRPPGKSNALRWEFPGGKVEFGEDPRESIVREIKEELGIDIEVEDVIDVVSHVYGDKHVILIVYKCRAKSFDIKKIDINDYAWVDFKEVEKYDLCEADRKVVEILKKKLKFV